MGWGPGPPPGSTTGLNLQKMALIKVPSVPEVFSSLIPDSLYIVYKGIYIGRCSKTFLQAFAVKICEKKKKTCPTVFLFSTFTCYHIARYSLIFKLYCLVICKTLKKEGRAFRNIG